MPEPDYEILADAIFRQEGGNKTEHPYGIKSIKPKDKADARKITINTARNNFKRWQQAGEPGAYLDFLANRFVPAVDDPQGNINWRSNVPKIYAQLSANKPPATNATSATAPTPVLDPLLLRPLPAVNYPVFPMYPLMKQ